MSSTLDGHRTAERRSLAYHAEIATRIAADPALLEAARMRVRSWRSMHVAETYISQWAALLDRDPHEVVRTIVEDSHRMTAMRQVSPFAGLLDPRSRWKIWREVR